MNKGNNEGQLKDQNADCTQTPKPAPTSKMKKEDAHSTKDSNSAEPDSVGEECKEIEDLKIFLKNCCKSKRKVLIKPNIPIKWINDLKAKLAKIQSK